MSLTNVVMAASKVVTASYRILATTIMGYYLIKETVYRERKHRKPASDNSELERSDHVDHNIEGS